MVRPAQARQSTKAFSSWLSTVIDKTGSSHLQKELEQLRDSGADVYRLMDHASRVMSRGNKDFNFPLESADAYHQIYRVLLLQWNQFQTGSGMADMPPPEVLKPLVIPQIDKHGLSAQMNVPANVWYAVYAGQLQEIALILSLDTSLTPLAGGIAIGAP